MNKQYAAEELWGTRDVSGYPIHTSMSVVTWNIRGLNKAYKQKEIKEFIKQNKKAVIALVEHGIKEQKASSIINDQIIHGQVRTHSRLLAFGFTAIYGLHTIKDRLSMWQKLRQINSLQQGPWLTMGDINAILNSQDRQHSTIIQDMKTKDCREFMSDTGMNELPVVGRDYTWTNNHTYSRIDRGLVNIDWMMTMLSLKEESSPFRFFNCIAEHPQFIQEVDQAWSTTGKDGKLQGVWNKLKGVKQVIEGLNTQHYKGVEDRIKVIRRELQEVQDKMSSRLLNAKLIEEEKELKRKLEKWILIEESIYRQRLRVPWLKLGDTNSAYFFAHMKNRNSLNGIHALTNDLGVQLYMDEDIEAEILGYYKQLLGSNAPAIPAIDPNAMQRGATLKRDQQVKLIQHVTR
ncbi:uncharacterized protein [Nicotiana tomentosiformis]|uniref:uncharacterized protein n=1 Tax=Nicotiana tomentosiformis TaxID=4098 RepID=UPI00388CDD97